MSEFLTQSGGRLRKDSQKGILTLTRVYLVSTLAQTISFQMPTEDNPWGLPEIDRDAQEQPDLADWKLTITCEGAPAGGGGTGGTAQNLGETWEVNFASEQKPIQTFPQWDAFAKFFNAQYDQRDSSLFTGFSRKIKADGGMVPNPAYGVENYLSPKAVLTCSFTRRSIDRTIWRNLGKIDVPELPADFQMPDLGDRTWLKYSAIPIKRGNVIEHRLTWYLSDEGGWLRYLYSPRR